MTSKTYRVDGPRCRHCVASVSTEVRKVSGVRGVHVDLACGRITVSGEGFDDAAIAAAVDAAGYAVRG